MVSAVLIREPQGDLSSYLREIKKFPMLSADEEFALACRGAIVDAARNTGL
jgi:DNA-directed RNA polymerase sigma subunit (sigma70/sigma32)